MQLSSWASEGDCTSKYFGFFMSMLPDDVKSSLVVFHLKTKFIVVSTVGLGFVNSEML